MSDISELIHRYESGPQLLRNAVAAVNDDMWDQRPIEGRWSIREVICHLADSEIVYADRMKRVLVEENPTLFDADPNIFVPGLQCCQRNPATELDVITITRRHMTQILRSRDLEEFQRTGVHSTDGPMTLETLLERITSHIPHHIGAIEDKLRVLSA